MNEEKLIKKLISKLEDNTEALEENTENIKLLRRQMRRGSGSAGVEETDAPVFHGDNADTAYRPPIQKTGPVDDDTQFQQKRANELKSNDALVIGDKWERIDLLDGDSSSVSVTTYAGSYKTFEPEDWVVTIEER